MRAARLLDQARAAPARVPQGSHDERRQQRGLDRVPHRIGHRHMQRVAIQREVERVAAHLAGRLQPAGERELVGLAGEGRREQPPLDLRRERHRHRPLAPFEQVGVPAVGDHHVRQLVRGELHVLHGDPSRLERQHELQYADRLAAARDRREHARVISLPQQHRALPRERRAIGRALQRHPPRGLLAARSGLLRRRGVAQAVQRPPAEVGDQKAHLAGVEHLQQRGGQRVDHPDGRGRLRARQQRAQVQTARLVHARSLRPDHQRR